MEKVITKLKLDRNSNLELLRIILMIMIIFHHFAVHGGFYYEYQEFSFNHLWHYFLESGGKIATNTYVLISGYFLVKDKCIFNLKKVLKFYGELIFYSLTIFFVFVFFNKETFTLDNFIHNFFVLYYNQWWFATIYIVLFLFHPFINILIYNLPKKAYQTLIVISVILFSSVPFFNRSLIFNNDLIWFVLLYLIAGYINIYGFDKRFKHKTYLIGFISLYLFTYILGVSFLIFNKDYAYKDYSSYYFFSQDKITFLLISIFLFCFFATMKERKNKIINLIAASTFGVYLIHDNPYIRNYIWKELFKVSSYINSPYLFLYSILITFIIFIVCTFIDLIRHLISILLAELFNKINFSKIKNFSSKVYEKIRCLIFSNDDNQIE